MTLIHKVRQDYIVYWSRVEKLQSKKIKKRLYQSLTYKLFFRREEE